MRRIEVKSPGEGDRCGENRKSSNSHLIKYQFLCKINER